LRWDVIGEEALKKRSKHQIVFSDMATKANLGKQETPHAGPVSSLKSHGRGFAVLHVNDSTDDQVLFQAACKEAGVPLIWHVADSAEKGISYLETLIRLSKKHDVRWPDLILLDIMMPGHNGFKVLEYIRSTDELNKLPVVIFTGHDNPGFKSQAAELGANSFVNKPSGFSETVTLVGTLYQNWGSSQL
jgi:CheY-like chemotaxis protein